MKRNEWKIVASLAVTMLLGGCGLFDGGGIPPHLKEVRPGADRAAPVVKALPPPESNQPHEAGVAPADEAGGARAATAIGATIQGKGGQKAQKEEVEKLASELSRKAREERAAREAASGKATPPSPESPEPSKD